MEMTDTDLKALIAAREVLALRAALAFYADPANHIGHRDSHASVYVETSAVEADGGQRARAALEGGA